MHQAFDRQQQKSRESTQKINQYRQSLMDSIGGEAYNGVNLFEGTTPMSTQSTSSPHGSQALDGVAPNDPGVDLSVFGTTGMWKKLAGK